jgi:hypothetical protein
MLQGCGSVSVVISAKAFTPVRTPAGGSADMAGGGSGHADTINSYPARAACFADLSDHAVRLMKRRRRHRLRRWKQQHGDAKKKRASERDTCGHVNLLLKERPNPNNVGLGRDAPLRGCREGKTGTKQLHLRLDGGH